MSNLLKKWKKELEAETKRAIEERINFTLNDFYLCGVRLKLGMNITVEIKARKDNVVSGKLICYNPLLGMITIQVSEDTFKMIRLRDIKVITVKLSKKK
ncbi:MAG: hypothetical protein B6U76_06550 [Desulfurococcales archaeon ex4484_217_2]|nr:MAG: hypothetical protein B6U76_06550 [Desulfurococcales archaeon ex4484_217_2]